MDGNLLKVLLDTHAFIWWDSDPSRLSARALALLKDPATLVLLSVVSVWEMLIKLQLGKIALNTPLATLVSQQEANGIRILPVTLDHVLGVEQLPLTHKDPFDRILVAQARNEGAALLSADSIFAGYPVKVLW